MQPRTLSLAVPFLLGTSFFLSILAVPVLGQEPPAPETPGEEVPVEGVFVQETAPPGMAALEEARSRRCVPAMARLEAVDARLEPLSARARRIAALNQAVGLEDRSRVDPLDPEDSLESAVAAWFQRDEELAGRLAEEDDEALRGERSRERETIRQRLRETFDSVNEEAQAILAAEEEALEAAADCEGAILVRSAVLEACQGTESPVCAEAEAGATPDRFRFVDAAEDLWDLEQLRPWSDPVPLQATPQGLGGARTASVVRRGNVMLGISVEPMLQPRTSVSQEEAAQFDEYLEALEIEFDEPRFVMAPALSVELEVPGSLAGETHYLLHFGDLSAPAEQVFWTFPAGGSGTLQDVFPAPAWVLSQLVQGEEVWLTAVTLPEDDSEEEGQAHYSLSFPSVGQSRAVGTLLGYMSSGDLARDLSRLVPEGEAGSR